LFLFNICADTTGAEQQAEFERIKNMATYAHSIGLQVNAGHGLTLFVVSNG
jgi:pyridoxine 5-phosphate synthase